MNAGPKLVQLRERPPLTDLPGRLEELAKQIRAGELPVDAVFCVVVDKDDRVAVRTYGAVKTAAHSVGVMSMALHELTMALHKPLEKV